MANGHDKARGRREGVARTGYGGVAGGRRVDGLWGDGTRDGGEKTTLHGGLEWSRSMPVLVVHTGAVSGVVAPSDVSRRCAPPYLSKM